MKDRNKKVVRWGLFLGWMIFIFYMSHQPGDKSSEQSKFVLYIFNLREVIICFFSHKVYYFILICISVFR